MDSLIKNLRRTLSCKLHLRRDVPIVVALSGGADSVALLSALMSEGYNCVAAHCNFHLRGEESLRDMRFAEKITEKLGVDLYVTEFNVAAALPTATLLLVRRTAHHASGFRCGRRPSHGG